MAEGVPEPKDEGDKQLAAVSYILTWLTGLLVLVLAKEDQRFARWHAIQAIGLGVVAYIVLAILGVLQFFLFFMWTAAWGAPFGWEPSLGWSWPLPLFTGGLPGFGNLAILIVAIVFAVQAYGGKSYRIPLVADLADRHA